MSKKNIAIIPARAGSKGLKNKNIKMLNGKPMVAYTIDAAKKSNMFDTIFVSTDSYHYAEISKSHGAEVPFLRSEMLASDEANSWDVVRETLKQYQNLGKQFNTFMLLQPTSPLRTEIDIRNAYDVMKDKAADAVVSVCEVDHSPLWCNTLPEDGNLAKFLRNEGHKRRQDLDIFYRLNGAIYLSKVESFINDKNIYKDKCYAYIMSVKNSIDVDTQIDFDFAEMILKNNK